MNKNKDLNSEKKKRHGNREIRIKRDTKTLKYCLLPCVFLILEKVDRHVRDRSPEIKMFYAYVQA